MITNAHTHTLRECRNKKRRGEGGLLSLSAFSWIWLFCFCTVCWRCLKWVDRTITKQRHCDVIVHSRASDDCPRWEKRKKKKKVSTRVTKRGPKRNHAYRHDRDYVLAIHGQFTARWRVITTRVTRQPQAPTVRNSNNEQKKKKRRRKGGQHLYSAAIIFQSMDAFVLAWHHHAGEKRERNSSGGGGSGCGVWPRFRRVSSSHPQEIKWNKSTEKAKIFFTPKRCETSGLPVRSNILKFHVFPLKQEAINNDDDGDGSNFGYWQSNGGGGEAGGELCAAANDDEQMSEISTANKRIGNGKTEFFFLCPSPPTPPVGQQWWLRWIDPFWMC